MVAALLARQPPASALAYGMAAAAAAVTSSANVPDLQGGLEPLAGSAAALLAAAQRRVLPPALR
jgi:hypothetical protein